MEGVTALDADSLRDALGMAAADLDDQLDAISAKTALIGSGSAIVQVPQSADGTELEIIRGASYRTNGGDARALSWSQNGATWFNLQASGIEVYAETEDGTVYPATASGTSPNQVVTLELTRAQTRAMEEETTNWMIWARQTDDDAMVLAEVEVTVRWPGVSDG